MDSKCKVEGCQEPVTRRPHQECESHFYRRTTYGNYHEQRRTRTGASWEERLSNWSPEPGPLDTDCWIWQGTLNSDGYATVKYNQKAYKAYRVMWERHNEEEIPPGMNACHRCDQPACVNPAHIFIGTQVDNIMDMVGKSRQRAPRGLTDSQVRAIRSMVRGGMKQSEVVRMMGLDSSTVSRIVNNKLYKDVV